MEKQFWSIKFSMNGDVDANQVKEQVKKKFSEVTKIDFRAVELPFSRDFILSFERVVERKTSVTKTENDMRSRVTLAIIGAKITSAMFMVECEKGMWQRKSDNKKGRWIVGGAI